MPRALVSRMLNDDVRGLKPREELVSFVPAPKGPGGGSAGFHSFSRTFNFDSLSSDAAFLLVEKAQKAFRSNGAVLAGEEDGSVSHHFSARDSSGGHCKYSVKIVPETSLPVPKKCGVSASLFVATNDRDTAKLLAQVAERLLSHAMLASSERGFKVFKKPSKLFGEASRVFCEPLNYGVEYR